MKAPDRRTAQRQRQTRLVRGPARDDESIADTFVPVRARAHHVLTGRHADPRERRGADVHVVERDERAGRVREDGERGDARALLGERRVDLRAHRGLDGVRRPEQLLVRVHRRDGMPELGLDRCDVVENHRRRRDALRLAELGQRLGEPALVVERHAAREVGARVGLRVLRLGA